MSVEIDPPELGFRRPFQHEVSQVLRLRNPNNDPIAFKVKTTAPKQYCVRPNSGRIEPNAEVEIQVLLQAMREDPPPDTRCRDKFLVQSVAVSPDKEFNNWQSVDRNGRSTIQEQKIRVVFLPPSGDGGSLSTQRLTNGMYGVDDSTSVGPPAYSPPSPHHLATPESSSHNSSNARNLRQSTPYSDTETSVAYETAPSNTVSSAVAGVSNEIPSMPELKEAVVGAKETAMSSIAQHDDQGLRQRKAGGESSSQKEKTPSLLATLAPTQASEGVPVQIVAILCLLSFLIAYLFF